MSPNTARADRDTNVGVEFNSMDPAEQAAFEAMSRGEAFDPETFVPPDPGTGDGDGSGGDSGDAGAGSGADGQTGGQRGTADPGAGENQRSAEDDDADGVITTTENGKPQKRVSFHKYQRLEKQFNDLKAAQDAKDREAAAKEARLQERLEIINEALATPGQRGQQGDDEDGEDADPMPNPEENIFAFSAWQGRQLQRMSERMNNLEGNVSSQREADDLKQTYINDAIAFANTPDGKPFAQAYSYLVNQRMQELELANPGMSVADRQKIVAREEQGLVRNAVKAGKSPAQLIFNMAKGRGFTAKAAPAPAGGQQQQQNGKQAPKQQADPNALDNPANVSGGGQQQQTDVRAIIDGIKNGQNAQMSLSNVGGAAPPALTAELLANMSEEDFAALVDRLPESKLRELMGD